MTIHEHLNNEELIIKEEIENVLRQMCFGRNYRKWSEDMVNKLYIHIYDIVSIDLAGQDLGVGRLMVDEEIVITAMMLCLNED